MSPEALESCLVRRMGTGVSVDGAEATGVGFSVLFSVLFSRLGGFSVDLSADKSGAETFFGGIVAPGLGITGGGGSIALIRPGHQSIGEYGT